MPVATTPTLNLVAWIALRVTVAYVYLYALYKNTQNSAARQWTVDHTAYMLPKLPESQRTRVATILAVAGMLMMAAGGISVLLGLEGRIGGLLLLVFTSAGIYSHKRERDIAIELSSKIQASIPPELRIDFTTLQWSAFSGHFSSGLKNWALCGVSVAFAAWGTGPLSLSDRFVDYLASALHAM